MPDLTKNQRDVLLRPIKSSRVKQVQGQSHLEAFDVIAHLTRIFGFEGWDKEILTLDVVSEVDDAGKHTVVYRCTMRLTVRNTAGQVVKVVEDVSTGDAVNQRTAGAAHDLAVKSAVSGALKRCAKDLGDQFGLSLYDGGSEFACVKAVVPYTNEDPEPPDDDQKLAAGADRRELPPVATDTLAEARAKLAGA